MDKEIKHFLDIMEGKTSKLELNKLGYSENGLAPVLSKKTIDYHYKNLAKSYVDRFNKGEGDPKFNKAGAFLHNIYFPGLKPPQENNKPTGISKELIDKKYSTFNKFKDEFSKVAMGIQGSGWVYMDFKGNIKTITNHEVRNDIAMLVDWWEHAWALDYQQDKKGYLENTWKIIDWDKVNSRIQES